MKNDAAEVRAGAVPVDPQGSPDTGPAGVPALTDEQIHKLWLKNGPKARDGSIIKFARALAPAGALVAPPPVHPTER